MEFRPFKSFPVTSTYCRDDLFFSSTSFSFPLNVLKCREQTGDDLELTGSRRGAGLHRSIWGCCGLLQSWDGVDFLRLLGTSVTVSDYWGNRVLAGRGILEEEVENLFLLLLLVLNQKMLCQHKEAFCKSVKMLSSFFYAFKSEVWFEALWKCKALGVLSTPYRLSKSGIWKVKDVSVSGRWLLLIIFPELPPNPLSPSHGGKCTPPCQEQRVP